MSEYYSMPVLSEPGLREPVTAPEHQEFHIFHFLRNPRVYKRVPQGYAEHATYSTLDGYVKTYGMVHIVRLYEVCANYLDLLGATVLMFSGRVVSSNIFAPDQPPSFLVCTLF